MKKFFLKIFIRVVFKTTFQKVSGLVATDFKIHNGGTVASVYELDKGVYQILVIKSL